MFAGKAEGIDSAISGQAAKLRRPNASACHWARRNAQFAFSFILHWPKRSIQAAQPLIQHLSYYFIFAISAPPRQAFKRLFYPVLYMVYESLF